MREIQEVNSERGIQPIVPIEHSPEPLWDRRSCIIKGIAITHPRASISPTHTVEILVISLRLARVGRKVAPLEQNSLTDKIVGQTKAMGVHRR